MKIVFVVLLCIAVFISGSVIYAGIHKEVASNTGSKKYDITIWHKDGTVDEIIDADSYIRYSGNAVNVKKGKNKYYYISTDLRVIEH